MAATSEAGQPQSCSRRSSALSRLLLTLSLLLLLLAAGSGAASESLHRSMVLDRHSGRLKVVPGLRRDSIAWANFTDRIKATGPVVILLVSSEQQWQRNEILLPLSAMIACDLGRPRGDKNGEKIYKYFEEIFNASGKPALVKEFGDWFSYTKSPRALIFRRNQTLVTDMDSMIKLMRYNNFKNDPLSECQQCDPKHNGENSISARSDLNPANGTYPFSALGLRSHGGTDMKVTSFELHSTYRMIAVNGPTWDEVPAFQWSKSPFSNLVHMGLPDLWRFLPVMVQWK
uniref:putative phospholipase B-like 2 n=1 Tax=Pristiophorus japonicus TaxID=55135 RepID=UPI00398EC610